MIDARIVIVGAGLAGASTAYHLHQLGERSIILLERERVAGVHASGRNAALVRSRLGDAALQPFASAGAHAIAHELPVPFRPVGSLLVGTGRPDEQVDVASFVPAARGTGVHTPTDGVVDVAALLAHYLRGQDVRFSTTVHGWRPIEGGLELDTDRGALRAGTVVNAAGAWAGVLGDLPLEPLLRHLFVTDPDPRVDPEWPFIWDVEHGLYFRPESGGLLICPCDESRRTPGDYTERWGAFELLVDKVDRLQPGLRAITRDLSIAHRWAGQRTFAPDRRFVIGFDPRQPALFWVAALGGHGVTTSWEVGRRAARLLLAAPAIPPGDVPSTTDDRARDAIADPLSPARLAGATAHTRRTL